MEFLDRLIKKWHYSYNLDSSSSSSLRYVAISVSSWIFTSIRSRYSFSWSWTRFVSRSISASFAADAIWCSFCSLLSCCSSCSKRYLSESIWNRNHWFINLLHLRKKCHKFSLHYQCRELLHKILYTWDGFVWQWRRQQQTAAAAAALLPEKLTVILQLSDAHSVSSTAAVQFGLSVQHPGLSAMRSVYRSAENKPTSWWMVDWLAFSGISQTIRIYHV